MRMLKFMFLVVVYLPFALPAEVSNETRDSTQDITSYKYAAVVDCGSSGSRAHLFRWQVDGAGDPVPATLEPLKNATTGKDLVKRIQPGLSSFADKPGQASNYMRPVMDFISAQVPEEVQPDTPVYFLGTAGLRLLSHEEQQQILDDMINDLKLEYRFSRLYGGVISGSQEGTFQWISVNAIAGRLTDTYDQAGSANEFHCKSPYGRRYGMIEMGGASTQISFELSPQLDLIIRSMLKARRLALAEYSDLQVEVKLSKHRATRLLSASFLGLGSNSARELATDLLVRDSLKHNPSHPISLYDPCLPSGSEESVQKPVELLMQSRTAGSQWRTANLQTSSEMFTVRLIGRGNYPACQKLLIRVIKLARSEQLNCGQLPDSGQKNTTHLRQSADRPGCPMWLLGTNFVPFRQIQFIGLSELFYTTDEIIQASGRYNALLVQSRTNQVCATPFQVLLQRFPQANRVDSERVLHECFKATWMLTFLHVGLRMPFNSGDLQTVSKINGTEIDWTLGAMFSYLLSSH